LEAALLCEKLAVPAIAAAAWLSELIALLFFLP
jgi:hypothetical protein